KRVAGTSTLTQQLVKNAILTHERNITRKIKEAILSIRLEQKYSKDQILQIYFNEIPYGSTNYGVESAAQGYFGKSVSDLNLAESATLAGFAKAPSTYLTNSDALLERRNFVLRRMFEEGYITQQEKEDAQAEPLTLSREFGDIKAPHFVLDVKQQLVGTYGAQLVDTGGLKVITTLDWEKQQIAEGIIGGELGTKVLADAGANNTSLVSLDPRTGQILAMVGSKDFYNDDINGKFNVATLAKRQPGSSFKPIIYAAAFEKGYTPNTVLFDVETNFSSSGKEYRPLNYNLKELGPVTMKQALQGSLNIPAVKTLYLVGAKEGVKFSERLGYTTLSDGDFGLSLVLGGGGVNPLEHATAYAIIANEGKKVSPVSILRVEDYKGDVLEEWKPKKQETILDRDVALTLSNVLIDDQARAYAFGAGGVLTLPGRPVAAKTGTTNSYIDAWAIGYTPSLVTVVWAGNTNNSPMKRGFGGSIVAAPIWQAYMKEALEGTPVESFPTPKTDEVTKAILNGATGGGITLKVNRVTGKLATSSTPEKYIVTRTYTQPHSILHYVDKDTPRGPIPENPEQDPQYRIWEDAIADWVRRKSEEDPNWEISFEEPPIESDDIYSLELIPILQVVYPQASSTIQTRTIDTDIRVSAPRGVTKVTYEIDGVQVGIVREHPFNLNYVAKTLTPGDHILTITVEDDVGNVLSEDIPFTFDNSFASASIFWESHNQFITKQDFPRTFTLHYDQPERLHAITITAVSDSGENIPFESPQLSTAVNTFDFVWRDPPKKGKYLLIVTAEDDTGNQQQNNIEITVQ
ncbi:MAG: hypothetical protein COU30_00120, partial [Candidatus Magasanikbacteria bacterium CG10_big_fil_rev_8_21_14_0_10_38_6]